MERHVCPGPGSAGVPCFQLQGCAQGPVSTRGLWVSTASIFFARPVLVRTTAADSHGDGVAEESKERKAKVSAVNRLSAMAVSFHCPKAKSKLGEMYPMPLVGQTLKSHDKWLEEGKRQRIRERIPHITACIC